MGNVINFKNRNSSKIFGTGNEDSFNAVDDFDHIEDIEEDVLETIEAEVKAENLEQTLDDAIDDLTSIQQGDMELDLVEDVNNNYEMVVTDEPAVVTKEVVATATESITFRLSNNLNIPSEQIKNKITRRVAREQSIEEQNHALHLQALTGSTRNYIQEIRTDFMNIVASLFDREICCPNVLKMHTTKIRMLKTLLAGNRSGKVVDREMYYVPIAAAYQLCGSNVNDLVTYIGNMSMRPVDNIIASINSGSDYIDAFTTSAAMLSSQNIASSDISALGVGTNGANFVTSIIGNIVHIVNVYPSEFGVRYNILELPFGEQYVNSLNPTPISSEGIREIFNNIICVFQNFSTVQSEIVESLGTISNKAKNGDLNPDVVKATMAVGAKTAKGILHAYTFGIDQVLNICIAEAISNA